MARKNEIVAEIVGLDDNTKLGFPLSTVTAGEFYEILSTIERLTKERDAALAEVERYEIAFGQGRARWVHRA